MQEVFEKIINSLRAERDMDRTSVYDIRQCDTLRFAFEHAAQIVEQKVAEYNNGWIPCSSGEMPREHITKDGHIDPSEEVLVYIYYGENCVNNGCRVSRYWEHTKSHENPWIDLKFGKENVIAWQPLPAPYQPKEESQITREINRINRMTQERMQERLQLEKDCGIGYQPKGE